MLRSTWMTQEILTTFPEEIDEVSLIPSRATPGGEFIVTLNGKQIWNRKESGRFPEMKELKQLIRDSISPEKDLGHSDGERRV